MPLIKRVAFPGEKDRAAPLPIEPLLYLGQRRRPYVGGGILDVHDVLPTSANDEIPADIAKDCRVSNVIGLGRMGARRPGGLPPCPVRDLGHVVTVPGDVLLVLDKL